MRPKVGLALGSGGPRGMAHIGVLRVLEKHNIPIDYIAGSSIGALIGSFYSLGMDMDLLAKFVTAIESKKLLDFSPSKNGLIRGKRIEKLLKLFVNQKGFNDMRIPMAIVATDLNTCQRKIFREGDLFTALRASISIPVLFPPVQVGESLLVDGGVIDRVPGTVVREMGADVVIAVDVGWTNPHFGSSSMLDVFLQVWGIMEQEIVKHRVEGVVDVYIHPDVEEFSPITFDQSEECIAAGEKAALEALPKIQEFLQISA